MKCWAPATESVMAPRSFPSLSKTSSETIVLKRKRHIGLTVFELNRKYLLKLFLSWFHYESRFIRYHRSLIGLQIRKRTSWGSHRSDYEGYFLLVCLTYTLKMEALYSFETLLPPYDFVADFCFLLISTDVPPAVFIYCLQETADDVSKISFPMHNGNLSYQFWLRVSDIVTPEDLSCSNGASQHLPEQVTRDPYTERNHRRPLIFSSILISFRFAMTNLIRLYIFSSLFLHKFFPTSPRNIN